MSGTALPWYVSTWLHRNEFGAHDQYLGVWFQRSRIRCWSDIARRREYSRKLAQAILSSPLSCVYFSAPSVLCLTPRGVGSINQHSSPSTHSKPWVESKWCTVDLRCTLISGTSASAWRLAISSCGFTVSPSRYLTYSTILTSVSFHRLVDYLEIHRLCR